MISSTAGAGGGDGEVVKGRRGESFFRLFDEGRWFWVGFVTLLELGPKARVRCCWEVVGWVDFRRPGGMVLVGRFFPFFLDVERCRWVCSSRG